MLISWQWILLIVIALIGGAVSIHYQRRAETIAARLTPEERAEFNTRFMTRADRAEMPARFNDLAAATDKVRGARSGVTVILAIALLYFLL